MFHKPQATLLITRGATVTRCMTVKSFGCKELYKYDIIIKQS